MKTKIPLMKHLEKKKLPSGRFLIGLTFALATILAAFEWRTAYNIGALPPGDFNDDLVITEEPPIFIIQKIKEEPQTPKQKKPSESIKVTTKIEITDKPVEITKPVILPDPGDIKPINPNEEPLPVEWNPFIPVEQMPEFPGGEIELLKFLKKNLNYPKRPKELGITGTVYVEFIINTDGTMTDLKIAKGVYPDIDKEAIRVVSLMPKWIPGSQRNQPVPVGMRLPIRFTLK